MIEQTSVSSHSSMGSPSRIALSRAQCSHHCEKKAVPSVPLLGRYFSATTHLPELIQRPANRRGFLEGRDPSATPARGSFCYLLPPFVSPVMPLSIPKTLCNHSLPVRLTLVARIVRVARLSASTFDAYVFALNFPFWGHNKMTPER